MPPKRQIKGSSCCGCAGKPRRQRVPAEGVPPPGASCCTGAEGEGVIAIAAPQPTPVFIRGPPQLPQGGEARQHRRGRSDLASSVSARLPAFQGCGCGEVRALPGLLQSRGRCSHTLAAEAEAGRDFTRAFSGCRDGKGEILLLVVSRGKLTAEPPSHIVCSDPAAHGDVNAAVVETATEAFREGVLKPALLAAGGGALSAVAQNAEALSSLCVRVVGNCTVGAAMDVLMGHDCVPQLFQNKYVVLVSGGEEPTVRVLTYGFVGDPIGGDRPDTKHTQYVLRLLTENLLQRETETETGTETGTETELEKAAAAAAAASLQPTVPSVQVQYSVCSALMGSAAKPAAGGTLRQRDAVSIEEVIEDDGRSGRILASCLLSTHRDREGQGPGAEGGVSDSIGASTSASVTSVTSSSSPGTEREQERQRGTEKGVSALLEGPRCELCGESSNTPRPQPAMDAKAERKRQLASERRGKKGHRRNNSF